MKPGELLRCVGCAALTLMMSSLPVFAQKPKQVMLNEGTRLTLRLNEPLSTKTARPGDRFTAEVVTPVYKKKILVIPAKSRVTGRVGRVRQAGRMKGRAEMDLRFERLRLPNGAEEPIVARLTNLDGVVIGLGTILAMRSKHVELPRGTQLDIVLDRPLRLPVGR